MPRFHTGALHPTHKESVLLRHLEEKYTDDLVRKILVPFIRGTSPISLRVLDWTVVNWSKKNLVFCESALPGRYTNVHETYKASLSFWKRRLFDPFRRRSRVEIDDGEGSTVTTTLGQANFMLFAHNTGILTYVASHLDEIEEDMNRVTREQKRKRVLKKERSVYKRCRLVNERKQGFCVIFDEPSYVTFE